MTTKAYARAGVDIDLGNRLKSALPRLLARTHRPEVLGQVGGFGGLFALDVARYREPVLVSSVDGVGTKLKVAFALGRHDTIGEDLVNHCVNDIAVVGAEPLFFLDYLAVGKLEPRVFTEILRGFARGCARNGCALIGGETAQLPGFYAPGEYDVCGTIVGVVERSELLDGPRAIRVGDAVLGIASSGLHTNGYTLARRILFEQLGLKPNAYVPAWRTTVGRELLKVHRSYGPLVRRLLTRFHSSKAVAGPHRRSAPTGRTRADRPIRAFAHITGGGLVDNIPRVLPADRDVRIRKGTWRVPPVFSFLADQGRIPEAELYQVFNMGIGFVAIVDVAAAEAVLATIHKAGHRAWPIGEVVRGQGRVRLE